MILYIYRYGWQLRRMLPCLTDGFAINSHRQEEKARINDRHCAQMEAPLNTFIFRAYLPILYNWYFRYWPLLIKPFRNQHCKHDSPNRRHIANPLLLPHEDLVLIGDHVVDGLDDQAYANYVTSPRVASKFLYAFWGKPTRVHAGGG